MKKKRRPLPKRIRFKTAHTTGQNVFSAIDISSSTGRVFRVVMCMKDVWILHHAVKQIMARLEGGN